MLKILYVGLRFDYGNQQNGDSYEFWNIEPGLKKWCLDNGHELIRYYPDANMYLSDDPSEFANKRIEDVIQTNDCIFHVEFNDTYDLPLNWASELLRQDKPVICWSSDASYRFHNWILPRKERYSHFVTTHSKTLDWYKQNDMMVIKSQWAASPLYKRYDDLSKINDIYDISFVGQCHGHYNGGMLRRDIADAMFNAGIDLHIWGQYWDKPFPYQIWYGRAETYEKLIEINNSSKIGLNLLNGWATHQLGQIKGRIFEIPACGTMQLSTNADDLENYFEPDKEIIIASSTQELIDKAKYYLKNDSEREKIAEAGYNRTLRDHQWSNRFDHIFKEVGLI